MAALFRCGGIFGQEIPRAPRFSAVYPP